MSESATMTDRFRAMPRALQWGALAGIAMGLFLLWDGFIAPQADAMNKDAARVQVRLNEVIAMRDAAEKLEANKEMERIVTNLGPVEIPGNDRDGSDEFLAVVNQLLAKHGATNQDFAARSRDKLPKTALQTVIPGRRVERLTADIKFDATPSAAAAIIADLESSPDVEAVDSVRLTRDAGGKVKVHLTIEAWVLSSEAPKGGSA